MFDPKTMLRRVDWLLIMLAIGLTVVGILFIYSSGINSAGILVSDEYIKQIFWAISGFLLMISCMIVRPKKLFEYSFYLYAFFILLLIYTRFFGRVVNGSRSWLGIGGFGVQPSEFAKLATIIYLSHYLSTTMHMANSFRRFIFSAMIAGVPFLLIMSQPDFGTAMVYIPMYLFMAFFMRINFRYLYFVIALSVFTVGLILLPLWQTLIREKPLAFLQVFYETPYLYYLLALMAVVFVLAFLGYRYFKKAYYYWIQYTLIILGLSIGAAELVSLYLREYQMMRLIVFFDPHVDPLGSGWHILQSLTAIGSGGLSGKGFLQGTHSHYRYLPTQSTDFIFSIISEEIGFIGAFLIIAAYFLLILRIFSIMRNCRDSFTLGVCAGISSLLLFHFLVNVGMTIGVMPITGIPLWFLSYGGSSLLTIYLAMGLILSINARRLVT